MALGATTDPYAFVHRMEDRSCSATAFTIPRARGCGHRVVHGGPNLRRHKSSRITGSVIPIFPSAARIVRPGEQRKGVIKLRIIGCAGNVSRS